MTASADTPQRPLDPAVSDPAALYLEMLVSGGTLEELRDRWLLLRDDTLGALLSLGVTNPFLANSLAEARVAHGSPHGILADSSAAAKVRSVGVSVHDVLDHLAQARAVAPAFEAPRCASCSSPIPSDDYSVRPGERARCRDCKTKSAAEKLAAATLATIPARYAWASLDDVWLEKRVRDRDALIASRSLVGNTMVLPASIDRAVFLGAPSLGKTILAVALLRAWSAALRKTGMFVSARELAEARAMIPLGHGDAPLVSQAISAPLLLLDDIGLEPVVGAWSPIISVVDARYSHARPTIVTTTLDERALSDRYGGAIARRVYEGASLVRLALPPR